MDKTVGIYGEVAFTGIQKNIKKLRDLEKQVTRLQKQIDNAKAAKRATISRRKMADDISRINTRIIRETLSFEKKFSTMGGTPFQRESMQKRFEQAQAALKSGKIGKPQYEERMARLKRDMLVISERTMKADRASTMAKRQQLALEQRQAALQARMVARKTTARRTASARFDVVSQSGNYKPEVVAKYKTELVKLNNQLRRNQLTTQQYNVRITDMIRRMRSASMATASWSQKFNKLRSAMIAFTGAYTLFAGVNAINKVGQEFEAGAIMIETVFGKRAPEAMEFLRKESIRLGMDLGRSQKGFAKFSASAKPLGYTLEELQEMYTGINEAARVFNLSQDNVDGLMRAFEQMAGKGQVMAEELKLQIGDRLFGSIERGARAAGMSTQEFLDAMKKGEIQAKEFIPEFTRLLREEAAPGLEKALKNTQTAQDRLSNEWKMFMDSIFKSGLGDFLADTFNFLADALAALKPITVFLTAVLSGVLESITWVFRLIAAALGDLADAIGPEGLQVLADIGKGLGYIIGFFLGGALKAGIKILIKGFTTVKSIVMAFVKPLYNVLRSLNIIKAPKAIQKVAEASKQVSSKASGLDLFTRASARGGSVANILGSLGQSQVMIDMTADAKRVFKSHNTEKSSVAISKDMRE